MTNDLEAQRAAIGYDLNAGERHYRAFVGPPQTYDVMSAMQFQIATALGLREFHKLCDIGCGSLRAGRLFIPYLLPDGYCGVEPEAWLVQEGIDRELGRDILDIKRPRFAHGTDFPVESFDEEFDMMIAQSIFSHASRAQIDDCLGKVARVLKHGGVFACTFMDGPDYTGDEWVYPGCVTYRFATMLELGARHGLRCELIDFPHPNGQTWIGYTAADA